LSQRTYDIVFFHQSLHHVARIEGLLEQVTHALTKKGLVYLDEYIGPSRTEWSDERIAGHRAIYDRLPEHVKMTSQLPLPIQADDPSEAIRSGEILAKLKELFKIVAFRGYGGNLLSVVFPNLRRDELNDDVVHELIEADRNLVQAEGKPYYAVMLATPKRGVRGMLARARYWLEPKVKRIINELLHTVSR